MKEMLVFVLLLISVGISFGQDEWKKEGIKLPPPVCYASHEMHHSFVSLSTLNQKLLKSGSLKKATIEVTYFGFSVEAQQAFQYAVKIWENLIYSPVPIRVKAVWESLDKNVLGSCGPAGFYKNFNSTQIWNCYYPIALVEKMLGEEINSTTDYELVASFNKDISWYFGTDGNTPSNRYDFVSVVLHELTHGLGFSGLFYAEGGRGGYGSDGSSAAFDQFVRNKNGEQLVNSGLFANPSILLYQNLTSGWLDFNTRLANSKLPRLYAPSVWDDGSSIYHLDDASYPTGDANSLMTPFTGSGEAIFDPGPNTLAIMYEMGWKSISIRHQPLKDREFVSGPISFDARIESDYDLDSTRLYLVYSTNKFVKKDSVLLEATAVDAVFNAKLSVSQTGEVQYYFSATDVKSRRFVYPASAPARYLSFRIGVDNVVPIVKHEPIKYLLASDPIVEIAAEATDNLGVASVKVEYFVNGGLIKSFSLQNQGNDLYSGNLVFPDGSVKDGDLVSYRIVATDASSQNNIGRLPLSGYFTFKIEGFGAPIERYVTDFNASTTDFIGSDFKIGTVSGFDNGALNSAHPYPSPETDNVNFNLISLLKYPVILKTGGKMSFDEVVLVEPGDAGTKFGDDNFWDYVIVEGSKDGINNWKPLIDGYDSRAQLSWENLYNSSISGNNSTAVPTKALLVKREINLLANGNFVAGDAIFIRFRLFSDPYSHGWGWIIDNLAIQDVETATNPVLLSSGEFSFFPNPATDQLNIQFQGEKMISGVSLKAWDSSGRQVYNRSLPVGFGQFKVEIDVSRFSPGLYLFAVEPEKGQAITRKILIQ
jgi:hypothetical protein